MNKFFKITAQVVGFLIVLYVLLMIFLYIFVQTKNFKPIVEKFFYQQTGQALHVKGAIKLSIFPWPSVKASNIIIDNPKNLVVPSKVKYFAKIGDVQVTVHITDLFHGEIKPKNILLDNININMVTARSGRTNWENLYHFIPSQQTKTGEVSNNTATQNNKTVAQNTANMTTIAQFPIIEISDTNLHFINLMTNQRTDVTDLQLRTPASRSPSQREVTLNCYIRHNNPNINLKLFAKTNIHFISQDNINLNDLQLGLEWITFKTQLKHPITLTMNGKTSIRDDNFKSQFNGRFSKSQGDIEITTSRQNKLISASMTLSNFDLMPLVKLLSGKDWIKGTLNANTELNTTGNTYHEWLNRLSGRGSFKVTNGKIYGLNIALLVTETLNRLLSSASQPQPTTDQSESTPFTSMSADFNVSNGMVRTSNFLLTAKQLKATGKGIVNLPAGTIDAKLLTTYADNTKWQIPIDITGPVNKPKVQPDTAAIAQRVLKDKLKQDVGNTLDNVKKQLDKFF